MNRIRTLVCLTVTSAVLSGCAGYQVNQPWCTLAGAAVGAGIGYGVNEFVADKGEEKDVRAGATAAGGALGAAVGTFLCAEKIPEPAPAPVAQTCTTDADGDGIPGDGETGCADRCPGTPAGVAVDADGCPKVGETLMRLEGVNFAFNSAKLTPESESILDKGVEALRNAGTASIRVEGHTDSRGTNAYNLKLSDKRSKSVVNYLVSKGIDASRLEPVGMGEEHPVASNKDEEGRYHNRRVEFVVSGK